ncbi:MAG: hypothetical protein WCA59_09940 [Candidatus Binataceae bacterium]
MGSAIIACGSFCWFDRKPAQPLRCTVNFTNLKANRPEEGKVMNAATLHYCPLCRTPHPSYGAVRAHLIVDHKRKMIEADVLLVKYVDLTKPIPERRIDAAQARDRRAVRIRPYSASGAATRQHQMLMLGEIERVGI